MIRTKNLLTKALELFALLLGSSRTLSGEGSRDGGDNCVFGTFENLAHAFVEHVGGDDNLGHVSSHRR